MLSDSDGLEVVGVVAGGDEGGHPKKERNRLNRNRFSTRRRPRGYRKPASRKSRNTRRRVGQEGPSGFALPQGILRVQYPNCLT